MLLSMSQNQATIQKSTKKCHFGLGHLDGVFIKIKRWNKMWDFYQGLTIE